MLACILDCRFQMFLKFSRRILSQSFKKPNRSHLVPGIFGVFKRQINKSCLQWVNFTVYTEVYRSLRRCPGFVVIRKCTCCSAIHIPWELIEYKNEGGGQQGVALPVVELIVKRPVR